MNRRFVATTARLRLVTCDHAAFESTTPPSSRPRRLRVDHAAFGGRAVRRSVVATMCLIVLASSVGAIDARRAAATSLDPRAVKSDAPEALASLDRRMADLDAEELSDKQELARVSGQLAYQHSRVLAHGREFYKLTRAGLLALGGGFGALVSHAMHVERARRLVVADVEDEARLRGRAVNLANELERTARDRIALARQRTATDAAHLAMQDELRRQAAFDKAFQTSTGTSGDYVAVYGGNGMAPDLPAAGFAASRGHLLFPVLGRTEVRTAHREGTEGPALEIRAATGAVVRAVFTGRVAFADRYGAYGRIVIVDHGDHYYTVSGNLNEIDVKIGQDVGVGERIGTVGDEGQGPMLYFEVRHGSQAVGPGAWLGLSTN